ncbi:hypothetical protein JHW38_19240 [Lysobacter enzymogenes]|nr:hypothetical protein [Lysobacter enzymogenes]QQP95353.1 hypothetical protein JHW38_19240 [Lysobacter enzymogenes]
MKRLWTIVGVADVARSFRWYQTLFGQDPTAPAHDYFGQILDSDGTVLICLHRWGAHEHPPLADAARAQPATACCCSSASTISKRRCAEHERSFPRWTKSRIRIPRPERRSSRCAIPTVTTSWSARCRRRRAQSGWERAARTRRSAGRHRTAAGSH